MVPSDSSPSAALDRLLEPSLSGHAARERPYSTRACFFVAFFGGALAIVLFSALNARRLRRPNLDLVLHGLTVVAVAGAIFYVRTHGLPFGAESLLGGEGLGRRHGLRILALLLWGASQLAYRPYYRAGNLVSGEDPSPWKAGLACTFVGGTLTLGIYLLTGGLS